jgi:hypothetical protein
MPAFRNVNSAVVHRDDVRVVERRRRAGFPQQSLAMNAGGPVGAQHLQRDGPAKSLVARVIDLSHPAVRDHRGDLVRTKPGARR